MTDDRIAELTSGGMSLAEAAQQAGQETQSWVNSMRGTDSSDGEKDNELTAAKDELAARRARKRETVVDLPEASGKDTPPPEEKPTTRTEAINEIRRARGQLF
jgi:hypothetical protein